MRVLQHAAFFTEFGRNTLFANDGMALAPRADPMELAQLAMEHAYAEHGHVRTARISSWQVQQLRLRVLSPHCSRLVKTVSPAEAGT